MTLNGKRALVTGASRGIGAAIAKALAAEGADVAITYEKSADRAREVVRAIESRGRRSAAIQADSADADAVQASVKRRSPSSGGSTSLSTTRAFFAWANSRTSQSRTSTQYWTSTSGRRSSPARPRCPTSPKAAASSPSGAFSPIGSLRRSSACMRVRSPPWSHSRKGWRGSSGHEKSRSISCNPALSTPI
jgi:short chain dehydrogenase